MAVSDDVRVLAWWMERQLDPDGPDVVPGPGATTNSTHRDWVLLGTTGAPERAALDPRGLLTPWPVGWSLDWWVGADDRWHLPSRSAAVRQRLVDDAPVVETAMRIPGGDLLHRAWAVAGGEGIPAPGAVVVELENASPVPVAVAVSIRPYNPLGAALVHAINLEGTAVLVDGFAAMSLPKPPSRYAGGDAATDAAAVVLAGDAASSWPEGGVRCSSGQASAAFLFPLPHTASLRVVLPLAPPAATAAARRRNNPVAALAGADPAQAPAPERVASGWEAQVRRSWRAELPEPRLVDALAAGRRHLLLHTAGEDAGAWPPRVVGGLDTSQLAIALDRQGLSAEAARLLLGYVDRQGLDGSFSEETQRVDAASAWLHAVGEHVRLTGSAELARATVGPVATAAHHRQRRRLSRRARRAGEPPLLPLGTGPSWVEPTEASYHDALWAWRGLADAAFVLDAAGQPDAAEEVGGFADALGTAIALAVAADLERLGTPVPPGGPGGRPGFATVGTVVALAEALAAPGAAPAGLTESLAAGCRALAPGEHGSGSVWHRPGNAGASPRLTAGLARAEVLAGLESSRRARWLLDTGAPLWRWPELVHPRTGGGCAGEGHHGAATAAVLDLIRSTVVVEAGAGLWVLPAVPPDWYGQPVEAHGVPTAHGHLSFAVRWHGERPALLWELEPVADDAVAAALGRLARSPFTLRAPGLDPGWSSTDVRGEALLAAPQSSPSVRSSDLAGLTTDAPSPAWSPAPPEPVGPTASGGGASTDQPAAGLAPDDGGSFS
jgi:hypothetical protein